MGGTEMVLILVVILVLFGAKKIPEFAKGLGQGIREFKKASSDITDSTSLTTPAAAPAAPVAPTPNTLTQAPTPNTLSDVSEPALKGTPADPVTDPS